MKNKYEIIDEVHIVVKIWLEIGRTK